MDLRPLSAEDFAKCMTDIAVRFSHDPEGCHSEMDDLMCDVLNKLGYSEGVKIFLEADKYYA